MQEQLRRLTHRAHEQQEQQDIQGGLATKTKQARIVGRVILLKEGKQTSLATEHDRARQIEQAEDTQGKPEIAHPVHNKRLHRGGIGRLLVIPKTDQQVA